MRLGCRRLNCLVGVVPSGADVSSLRGLVVENLGFAAEQFANDGIELLIESVDTQDIPGFFLTSSAEAVGIIEEVGAPNPRLQYDVYHMQIMEGNLIKTITANVRHIGHIQVAENLGRHEPGSGEINYRNLFAAVDALDYQGWIGCEYVPLETTADGLRWIEPYLAQTSRLRVKGINK